MQYAVLRLRGACARVSPRTEIEPVHAPPLFICIGYTGKQKAKI